MKTTLCALVAMVCSITTLAQSKTASALFNDNAVSAIETPIPFNITLVEKAIEERMSPYNVKARDQKGYKAYRGVKIDSISEKEIDIYFKIVRKGKKEKDASVVTMLISNGFEVFMTHSGNPEEFARAKTFMNSLLYSSAAADIDVQLNSQDDAVRKADRKLELLRDELNELRKKMKQTSEKLADTQKEIQKQEELLRKEKQILASLQDRRSDQK